MMTKSERTKQNIIETAASIFNEKGISGTTVDDVLKEAKVARGCLYNYFESKDDLSYQTADYLLNRISGKIVQVMSAGKTAREQILAYFNYSLHPLSTLFDGGCPILNLAVEADDNNEVIKQKVKKVILESHHRFVALLQQGIDEGEFTAELSPDEFAFKVFAAIEGGSAICRILGTEEPIAKLIAGFTKELENYTI